MKLKNVVQYVRLSKRVHSFNHINKECRDREKTDTQEKHLNIEISSFKYDA